MRNKRLLMNQLRRYAARVAMALVICAMPFFAMQAVGKAAVDARGLSSVNPRGVAALTQASFSAIVPAREMMLLAQAVTPVPPPAQRSDAESLSNEELATTPPSSNPMQLIVLIAVGLAILVAVMISRKRKGRELKI